MRSPNDHAATPLTGDSSARTVHCRAPNERNRAVIAIVLRHEAITSAGPDGASPAQARILVLLASRPHEKLRLSDVGRHPAVTPAIASDAVRALEEKGLLRKKGSARECRSPDLKITASGRKLSFGRHSWRWCLSLSSHGASQLREGAWRRSTVNELNQQ